MSLKLTAKSIKDLSGPPGGRPYVIHYDTDLPGFGLRITTAGARSFVLNYRAKGIERRMTIGSLPRDVAMDDARRLIDEARKEAAKLKSGAKYHGADPMAVRHDDRAAPTMADLGERYLKDHASKKRSFGDDKAMVERIILPALKNKRVADVDYAAVDDLHRKLSKTAPIRANRLIALMSKMFSLAIKWGWRKDNPARGIERNPENRRQRYLTPEELSRLSMALAKHGQRSSANAIRLLLLTGARRGEVLGATWDQFDLSEGTWTKPSSHTKQKKEHRVPISGPARQLIAEMGKAAESAAKKEKTDVTPFLFPGDNGKAQGELKRSWHSICKAAKIKGVRVHDLRHTYASVLVSAGLSLPIIGQLLGHTNPLTTSRYAHLFDDPLRKATEAAALVIEAETKGGADPLKKKSAEVVQIRKRR